MLKTTLNAAFSEAEEAAIRDGWTALKEALEFTPLGDNPLMACKVQLDLIFEYRRRLDWLYTQANNRLVERKREWHRGVTPKTPAKKDLDLLGL